MDGRTRVSSILALATVTAFVVSCSLAPATSAPNPTVEALEARVTALSAELERADAAAADGCGP